MKMLLPKNKAAADPQNRNHQAGFRIRLMSFTKILLSGGKDEEKGKKKVCIYAGTASGYEHFKRTALEKEN